MDYAQVRSWVGFALVVKRHGFEVTHEITHKLDCLPPPPHHPEHTHTHTAIEVINLILAA